MPPQIYNEEHRQFVSRKIVAAAQRILSGELGVIAGARQLCGLGHGVGADRDPDFVYFIAIDSQTDHLPIGEVRQRWNPEALREKDAEVAAFEAAEREKTFEICRRLIQKYESHDA
jgi:hypothetical protein